MNLSKSLEMALVVRGMKKKELAESLGVKPQQVSKWCGTGNISKTNIEQICNLLEMPVSEFVALGE